MFMTSHGSETGVALWLPGATSADLSPTEAVAGAGTRPAKPPRRHQGFALGVTLSALAASGLLLMVTRKDDDQRILDEIVSAHLRSLRGQHLIDVASSDQHTVKPWSHGRLDASPPVMDLTAQGFTLLGAGSITVDAKPVAAIVYRRRVHVINLFASRLRARWRALRRCKACMASTCAQARERHPPLGGQRYQRRRAQRISARGLRRRCGSNADLAPIRRG